MASWIQCLISVFWLLTYSGTQIKGEELSVLPGMDPILAMGVIERLTGFTGGLFKGMGKKDEKEYDVVVYDGLSSDEIFRMFGSAERARWVPLYPVLLEALNLSQIGVQFIF